MLERSELYEVLILIVPMALLWAGMLLALVSSIIRSAGTARTVAWRGFTVAIVGAMFMAGTSLRAGKDAAEVAGMFVFQVLIGPIALVTGGGFGFPQAYIIGLTLVLLLAVASGVRAIMRH